MNISIAGASGFVGKALTRMLLEKGHTVTGLGTSRSHPLQSVPNFSWISADTTRPGAWQESIAAADAVVNLAGRTIFKRWTRAYKSQLVESRQLTNPPYRRSHDRQQSDPDQYLGCRVLRQSRRRDID